jgi:hypothetical protein
MKRTVERIGPLAPAFATAGASVWLSSLLLATVPQALGPPPVVPPLTREVGRIVALLSPSAQLLLRGRSQAARPADRRSLSVPARARATSTPSTHRVSRQVGRAGAPSATPPPPPAPSPPPAPPVTPPPASVPVAQAPTDKGNRPKDRNKPGWGHGDPNHDHTGSPGKGSNGQKNQATSPGAGPPPTAGRQRGFVQNGEKKSTGR